MRPTLLSLLVAAGSVVAMVGPGAGPVAALTCAEHPDGSPQAIASGTERLSSEDRFLDHFDYAVIGTVTEIRTVEAQRPSPSVWKGSWAGVRRPIGSTSARPIRGG